MTGIDLAEIAEAAWEHLRGTYVIWDAYNDRDYGSFKDQPVEVRAKLIEALVQQVGVDAHDAGWPDASRERG